MRPRITLENELIANVKELPSINAQHAAISANIFEVLLDIRDLLTQSK